MLQADGWSQWIPFGTQNSARIPEDVRYGVYRNRLVDRAGVPIPIKRPGGTDMDGTVYIGTAGVRDIDSPCPMRARFTMHSRAHNSGKTGKARNKRLVRLWQKIAAKDAGARMEFQYRPLSSATHAKAVEDEMLYQFRRRFGVDPDDLWCDEARHLEPF